MASSARLDELRKKFEENPRRYFAPLANEYRKAGETDQAIAICREYLPQQPGHMSGHIVFGQALYEARQFEEAKTVFETALSLDPENLIALRHLGDISLILADTDGARAWYKRVLDADPRNEEIHAQLAALDKAAAAAPTPAVTPAQSAGAAALPPAKPTPSSAPTVVVSAMPRPAAAPRGPVTATSPTAEIRLDDASASPAPAAPEPEPGIEKSVEATLEVPPPAVPDSPLVTRAPAEERVSAPLEGLEATHVDAHPAPADSFSLEGLETTSMAAAPPLPPPPIPDLDFGPAGAVPPKPAVSSTAATLDLNLASIPGVGDAGTHETPPSSPPAPPPVSAPPVAGGDDLVPLDLDLGGVGSAPQSAAPVPDPAPPPVAEEAPASSGELELIMPEPAASATPTERAPEPAPEIQPDVPAAAPPESGPFVTETMAELYLQQGHREEALRVYRALLDQRPDDVSLANKVRRIESADAPPALAPVSGRSIGDLLRMVAMRRPGYRPEHENGSAMVAESQPEPVEELAPSTPPAAALPAMPSRGDALGPALGFSQASVSDEGAAVLLATAFATNGAPAIGGTPAHPAATELSLDSVFGGDAATPAPPPSSFSFDQFFAKGEGSGERAGGGRESPEEVAQFTQWLEGLKRR